jgi:hypothetical protein
MSIVALAESSGRDSGGVGDKSKSASDQLEDSNEPKHDGLPVPGVPAVSVDKHKYSNGSGLPFPGLPAVKSNGGSGGYITIYRKWILDIN